ncbi:MAG: hypothetical protein QMB39_09545 [Bacteroidales bacterium]
MYKLILFISFFCVLSCNNSNPDSSDRKEETINLFDSSSVKKGIITSVVDSYDVKVVNLWSTKKDDRYIIDKMKTGDSVIVLGEDDYYIYLQLCRTGNKGFCMKEYVIKSDN